MFLKMTLSSTNEKTPHVVHNAQKSLCPKVVDVQRPNVRLSQLGHGLGIDDLIRLDKLLLPLFNRFY